MKAIWHFFKRTWLNLFRAMKETIEKYVHPSVLVVENLKAAIESPIADILTAIIPGDLDDKIKIELRKYVPQILRMMKITTQCAQVDDNNAVIQCALDHLKGATGDERKKFWLEFAAYLSNALSDGKLSWNEAAVLAHLYYNEHFNK